MSRSLESNKSQVRCKGARMRITGEMTLYTAAALHARISKGLERPATELLDLSGVTEFDTAGLQLLLVARRKAAAMGRELHIAAVSPAVADVLDLLQLTAWVAPRNEAKAS